MFRRPVDREFSAAESREGFALVSTLLVVLVLSLLAVGVAWLATTEKKSSFAEAVHVSSLLSADAGGEAGINFLRFSETPPTILNDADKMVLSQGETAVLNSQSFAVDAFYTGKEPAPGWGLEYSYFTYRLESAGAASVRGESQVGLIASRLYKDGY